MSKKVLGIGLTIAGFALFAVPGVGAALGLAGTALLGLSTAQLIGTGLLLASNFLLGPAKPKALRTSPADRLHASLDATSPRKITLGIGNAPLDVRYQAFTGTNQEYLEQIICLASHAIQSIDEIWFDNEQAWTSGGGVQGRYVGYLTVTTRTEGTNANGIAIDAAWTANSTLTGCPYVHLKFKLTGNNKKSESPFSGGVTSRITIRVHGAKVYDPRLDSTVAGGSGSHRADDQATWAWDDNASRSPALQELWYELGWKINAKLAVGKGVPKARIDLASYATAANVCDETVTKSAANGGGTEPRYRSDGVLSEGDDPGAVRDTLCATMNAVLRDAGGKLALTVLKNDLATPVTPSGKSAFDADDVMGEMQWDQTPDLADTFNIVRGTRIDPSNNALYQPADVPEVKVTSNDGIDRIDTFNLPLVQSNGQAQRLFKQRLQRNQYQGRLSFIGKPAFWGLNLGEVFAFTHSAFGWTDKLFRCAGHKMGRDGAVEIIAVEENAAIYQWDNDEAAAVSAGTPTVYNPLNDPLLSGVNEAIRDRGAYAGGTTYLLNDVVQDQNLSWIYVNATAGSGNAPPALPATSNAHWKLWDTKLGAIADRASSGRNLAINGDAEHGFASPWAIETAATVGAGATLSNTSTSPIAGARSFLLAKAATSDGGGVNLPAIATMPGKKYQVRLRFVGNSATGSGLYLESRERSSAPTGDYVTAAQSTSNSGLILNAAVATTVTETRVEYTVPAGVYFFSLSPANYVNGPTELRFEIEIYDIADLELIGSGARVGDQRNLPNITTMNLSYKWPSAITFSAPSGGNSTISVAAATVNIGSVSISYNAMNVNVSGAGIVTYFLYLDDPDYSGGSKTLVATTTGSTIYQANGRVWVGSVTIDFGGGGGGGDGGGGGECVEANAWVETRRGFVRAREVRAGDRLRVLAEAREGTAWALCEGNSRHDGEPGWRIVSASGIAVTVSASTPITLRDGSVIRVEDIDGHELPVIDPEGFRWEPCSATPAGTIEVCRICCGQNTYAAGDAPERAILTHNPKP